MTPTQRVQAGLSALPDSYRGAQPGGLGTMRPAKYEPTRGEIREINQKYPRGADIPAYREKKILYDFGKEMGGTTFEDSSGIERLNLNKLGIKDPKTGATILSMMEPSLTAKAPTFSQLMGDIGRGAGSMLSGIAEAAMSGKLGFTGAVKGVWDKVRNYLGAEPTTVEGTAFPQPSSDTKDLFSSIDTGIAQVDPNNNMLVQIAKENQKQYEPFRVSNMDMNNVVAQNDGLPSLIDMYNFATNPQLNTNYGNFRLDNVLSGDPTLGYQTDIFGGQLGLTAQPNQFGFTFEKAFNKGGSVNKHDGLGYMFK